MQVINNPTYGDVNPGAAQAIHDRFHGRPRKRSKAELLAARQQSERNAMLRLHGRARASHLPSAATYDPWRGRGRAR